MIYNMKPFKKFNWKRVIYIILLVFAGIVLGGGLIIWAINGLF